jgi:RimJ/RimL family protein N-acetyltransferase
VFCKAEKPLIGFCGFRLFGEAREVELLYGIAPAEWGRGFATEAAQAMLRFGFEELGFDRVLAGADTPNIASFRVMEKIGMTLAKRPGIDGPEVVYYGISRKEFRPANSFYRVRLE